MQKKQKKKPLGARNLKITIYKKFLQSQIKITIYKKFLKSQIKNVYNCNARKFSY